MKGAIKHQQGLSKSSSLSALAKEALRARIITGEIEADQIYSVPSLAAAFKVSATPVREAMVELVSEGLVEVVPNQGFRVVHLTDHDLDEIFQIRLMLEVPAMVEVARGTISRSDSEHYTRLAEKIERCAEAEDEVGFLVADRSFHLGLLGTLHNERLVDIVSSLRDQARLYGVPDLAKRGELQQSAREHTDLIAAITSHDPIAVARLAHHHIEHTRGIWANVTEPRPQ
jgi:DNA-binding GntR family transcriptional regulator